MPNTAVSGKVLELEESSSFDKYEVIAIFKPDVWPAHAWFLEIGLFCEVYVCACVCVSTPKVSNN